MSSLCLHLRNWIHLFVHQEEKRIHYPIVLVTLNSFSFPAHLPTVPGYQAHNGFRCRSKLLFPTRISTSCNGGFPQQPRVVIRTTRIVCGASKSTFHHGDTSFCVSEHFCSSGFSFPSLPSLARLAGPARVADDWLAGLRYATFVPTRSINMRIFSRSI